jgi:DNA polymerase V
MSSTPPDKLFALVDCDNFYVSCERVFQPKLRNQPVVVLSNNDGCIVARSREVKALGVGMGKPFHEFKDIIYKHRVKVFSSNYTLYGDMSRRVMETLRELASHVDIYSIDEAFVAVERKDGVPIGRLIRETVLERTGIPVTVGIGTTKTLAKIAVEHAKSADEHHRVCDLTACPDPDAILASILVQDVWGIGLRIG